MATFFVKTGNLFVSPTGPTGPPGSATNTGATGRLVPPALRRILGQLGRKVSAALWGFKGPPE